MQIQEYKQQIQQQNYNQQYERPKREYCQTSYYNKFVLNCEQLTDVMKTNLHR